MEQKCLSNDIEQHITHVCGCAGVTCPVGLQIKKSMAETTMVRQYTLNNAHQWLLLVYICNRVYVLLFI